LGYRAAEPITSALLGRAANAGPAALQSQVDRTGIYHLVVSIKISSRKHNYDFGLTSKYVPPQPAISILRLLPKIPSLIPQNEGLYG